VIFGDLKQRVRALVDDSDASYTTDAFLAPLTNQCYEEVYNNLLATGANFERQALVLPNVPAQTTNLSQYQQTGQPLEFLLTPLEFWYKQTGLPTVQFSRANLVDELSDVVPQQFVYDWEWRSGVIYFTPSVLALDIRIRGDFLPASLIADGDAVGVIKNLGAALAYKIAQLVGVVRGNAGWQQAYKVLGDNALDDVAMYLTRKEQGKLRRVGRTTRHRLPIPTIFSRS
jgi:hypothetical protein